MTFFLQQCKICRHSVSCMWIYILYIFTPSSILTRCHVLFAELHKCKQTSLSSFCYLFEKNRNDLLLDSGILHECFSCLSRGDMRPRCWLIWVHFSNGKGKGAVILWETPVCLLRSPTINPAELKAGHHTDSIRWGGWQSAPWLPGYWLCFYLCALNWSEWRRERVSMENTHRFTTQWAARDAMDESNSVQTPWNINGDHPS